MLILSCPVGLPTQLMFAMPPALFSAYLTTLFTPHSLKEFQACTLLCVMISVEKVSGTVENQ